MWKTSLQKSVNSFYVYWRKTIPIDDPLQRFADLHMADLMHYNRNCSFHVIESEANIDASDMVPCIHIRYNDSLKHQMVLRTKGMTVTEIEDMVRNAWKIGLALPRLNDKLIDKTMPDYAIASFSKNLSNSMLDF